MAIIKCKMCGGDLNLVEGLSTAECEFCGSVQTVPKVDDEKKLTLFARANRLRVACEFDKAAGVYEAIVADFQEEAEAYWGLVLCKYGIEYVDDPATGKKIPTCHRSSFDSIMEDGDFEQALENADVTARRVYREEAKQIEEIRKGIIAVSAKEDPYDIFICYKETAENGDRTLDSVIAQDVYDALTDKGYRVFFSRITLEDKLGMEYEPYIFAALNSAKIMLAFGTDYEYYNAVWVKNEWSRFLKLMAKDKEKHLIPCFKGIDAYDMPGEFARLQAQDMGKVGAIQDLLRGIGKIIDIDPAAKAVGVGAAGIDSVGVSQLVRRIQMFLEDGAWEDAKTYSERVLDIDPECAEAYISRVLAEIKELSLENYVTNRLKNTEKNETKRVFYTYNTDQEFNIDSCMAGLYKKYVVPEFLSESDIQKIYNFDVGYYDSVLAVRLEQYEEEALFWNENRSLSRAQMYNKTDEIAQLKDRILSTMKARCDEALAMDEPLREKAKTSMEAAIKEYEAALDAAHAEALILMENALKGKNKHVPCPVTIEGDSLICPICGQVQRSNRRVCWSCGQKFINGQNVPYWCASCGREGPYDQVCPDCGAQKKVYNQ